MPRRVVPLPPVIVTNPSTSSVLAWSAPTPQPLSGQGASRGETGPRQRRSPRCTASSSGRWRWRARWRTGWSGCRASLPGPSVPPMVPGGQLRPRPARSSPFAGACRHPQVEALFRIGQRTEGPPLGSSAVDYRAEAAPLSSFHDPCGGRREGSERILSVHPCDVSGHREHVFRVIVPGSRLGLGLVVAARVEPQARSSSPSSVRIRTSRSAMRTRTRVPACLRFLLDPRRGGQHSVKDRGRRASAQVTDAQVRKRIGVFDPHRLEASVMWRGSVVRVPERSPMFLEHSDRAGWND